MYRPRERTPSFGDGVCRGGFLGVQQARRASQAGISLECNFPGKSCKSHHAGVTCQTRVPGGAQEESRNRDVSARAAELRHVGVICQKCVPRGPEEELLHHVVSGGFAQDVCPRRVDMPRSIQSSSPRSDRNDRVCHTQAPGTKSTELFTGRRLIGVEVP